MKVWSLHDLEGRIDTRQSIYGFNPSNFVRSKIQLECGNMIQASFPYDVLLTEVPIPYHKLYLDFLLPRKRIAFEIHGQQHHKYIPFFHGHVRNFEKSKILDNLKKEWCEYNDIEYHAVSDKAELKEVLDGYKPMFDQSDQEKQ